MSPTILGAVVDVAGKVFDRIFPDPVQKAQAQLELFKLQQSGELAELNAEVQLATNQTEINKEEAKSTDRFVSGWRPFIGWICGSGLAVQFIVGPMVTFGAHLAGATIDFPALDMGTLLTLLAGMLGLGTMRTFEKVKGTK